VVCEETRVNLWNPRSKMFKSNLL